MTIDLRFGRYQEALADVTQVDCVIVDAPYSARTHSGHDGGTRGDGHHSAEHGHRKVTRALGYEPWNDGDISECCHFWATRNRGWFVTITDHTLVPVWTAALDAVGLYTFAPFPVVEIGSRVRLSGDGPSSWTCWVVVARPKTREFQRWGTLPGGYVFTGHGDRAVMGGKRLDSMRALVRDYSRSGDLIADPCAGGATTLLAAAIEGRRAIGAEMMREHYDIAQKRIARGWTPSLFTESKPAMTQTSLLDAVSSEEE
jgi:site-specific DNA-methyltransferase (adenine-specific)